MKKFIALGFLILCFVACGEKDDMERVAKQYSKDILSGDVEQIAQDARTIEGELLNAKQAQAFIKEKKYLSQEYHILVKQSGGIQETKIYDNECIEKLPQEKSVCVVYLDLIFADSTILPMSVPLIEVDRKWHPVFDSAPIDPLPDHP